MRDLQGVGAGLAEEGVLRQMAERSRRCAIAQTGHHRSTAVQSSALVVVQTSRRITEQAEVELSIEAVKTTPKTVQGMPPLVTTTLRFITIERSQGIVRDMDTKIGGMTLLTKFELIGRGKKEAKHMV
jgi:hypothetical protein